MYVTEERELKAQYRHLLVDFIATVYTLFTLNENFIQEVGTSHVAEMLTAHGMESAASVSILS